MGGESVTNWYNITVGVMGVKLSIDEIVHLINVPVYGYGTLGL